jgi:SAM-dependent methyltransferase
MTTELEFTGERVIPGKTPEFVERPHIERYRFAGGYCRGKTVIDIGCGAGYGSAMLLEMGASRVFGVDVSVETIAHCQRTYDDPRLSFHVLDVADIHAFAEEHVPEKFGAAVCFEVIEHVPRPAATVRQIVLTLRDGAPLVISTPNRVLNSPGVPVWREPNNPYHIREFIRPEFAVLLRQGNFGRLRVFGQCRVERFLSRRRATRLYPQLMERFTTAEGAAVVPLTVTETAHTLTYVAYAWSRVSFLARVRGKLKRIYRQISGQEKRQQS